MAKTDQLIQRERLHPQDPGPIDPGTFVTLAWQDSCRINQRLFQVQKDELDYALKLRHYKGDTAQTSDQRAIQPHGNELFDTIRHEWSEICRVPVYIETLPQQIGEDDPALCEDARLAIESVINDPQALYRRFKRRWVMGALAARTWVMGIDVATVASKKQIVFRLVPPWKFHRAPGWQDIHDRTCPWVIEEADMRFGDVLANKSQGWDVAGIRPDGAKSPTGSTGDISAPYASSTTTPTFGVSDGDTLKVLKAWYRDDSTYSESTVIQLHPHDQYGECLMCGHQTDNVPRDMGGAPMGAETMPMCPACGQAPLLPIREAERIDVFARYPDGRLIIVSPGSQKTMFDGPWPYKMRSFPYAEAKCYDHPIEPAGQSTTSIHWSAQMILNNLRRFGWEQMRRNVDLLIAPWKGLVNGNNRTWTYNDLHGQVAFYKNAADIQGLKHFQGAGIPAGLPALYQIFANQFNAGRGTDQLGFDANDTKDIPVGTVEAILKQGAVPTTDKIEMIQDEESILFGIILDILVQIWDTDQALGYLGPDGARRVKMLKAGALTSMSVIVTASPTLSTMRNEDLTTFMQWTQLMITDPAAAMTFAEANKIPASYVQRYLMRKRLLAANAPPPVTPPLGGPNLPKPPTLAPTPASPGVPLPSGVA